MRAPKFIRFRADGVVFDPKLLVEGERLDLSFGEKRQRETVYVISSVGTYWLELKKVS